ncbi:MAG: hypothetical protein EPO13_08000 [Actinomycetota bacterium]|nr:MAG: hypothetical protein EPO13_08000 [Actinomycetota bacterium]
MGLDVIDTGASAADLEHVVVLATAAAAGAVVVLKSVRAAGRGVARLPSAFSRCRSELPNLRFLLGRSVIAASGGTIGLATVATPAAAVASEVSAPDVSAPDLSAPDLSAPKADAPKGGTPGATGPDASATDVSTAPPGAQPGGPTPLGPVLDRLPGPAVAPAVARGVPPPSPRRVVVVRRGDCLWHIASQVLPDRATAAAIDREWRRWYAENRRTIGPDPDLLIPGQRLREPTR